MTSADTAKEEEPVIESINKALLAAKIAQDKKGFNLSVLDVEGKCSYADAIVIASATSERQARAIADAIEGAMKDAGGGRPIFTGGSGGWALLDFGDVVVHVFLEDARAYYELDQMWSEAKRVPVPASAVEAIVAEPALAARRRRLH
jgi:ribosome-associated protein